MMKHNLDKAIADAQESAISDRKKPDMASMMKHKSVGHFSGPQGSGFAISTKGEYNDTDTEHHHFMTHDVDGKILSSPKYFKMTERKPLKTSPTAVGR